MPVLFWGLALPLASFAIQLIIWRIRLPRYQTKTILCIFVLVPAAVLPILAEFGPENWQTTPTNTLQYLHILLMHAAFTCAWVITYSAFEAESPTLVMADRLLRAGHDGVRKEDLAASMSDEVLLVPRVEDLVRDQMATVDEQGRYHLTPKGRLMLTIIYGYKKLLGASSGG